MYTCSDCEGRGHVFYEEDGRMIQDDCYHCACTGKVPKDEHWRGRLKSVAYAIAYTTECEYRKAANEDPRGDGYDLYAAENMMTSSDYFRSRVDDRMYDYWEQLAMNFSREDQEFLVAWNEYSEDENLPWKLTGPVVFLVDEMNKASSDIQDAMYKIASDSAVETGHEWLDGKLQIPDERNSAEDMEYIDVFDNQTDIPF